MKKIYYIEDFKDHFESIRNFLKDYFTVLPESEKRESELDTFISFINDKTNETNKKNAKDLLLACDPDLIIIDVGLGAAAGTGEDLYKFLIQKDDYLRNIPIIYLTKASTYPKIKLSSTAKFALKIFEDGPNLNIRETGPNLLNEINSLLGDKSESDEVFKY